MKSVVTILALIFVTVASSQTQIAGKVTDQKGAPIPGVNIFIEGTFDGTTTDENGDFAFATTAIGNQKLLVSMMAFTGISLSKQPQVLSPIKVYPWSPKSGSTTGGHSWF